MNEYSHMAETIKHSVSIGDAARFYGLKFNRAGFAVCPFHSEKTASFKIKGKEYAHCFGCGWSGDVIKFVMNMFNLDFPAAIRKLNDDFNLGLPIDRRMTLREQRDAEKRHSEILAEREREEAERAAYDALYNALWNEYARLDCNRIAYAPQSADEPFNDLYVEAVTEISCIEYLIDVLL